MLEIIKSRPKERSYAADDLYSLANPNLHSEQILRDVTYRVYNDETEIYDDVEEKDGLRWNLSDFTDFSYFFANTRVIFNYGKAFIYL